MDANEIAEFRRVVWDYYRDHGRDLPWRMPETDGSYDPYKILVSEIMLQQTQAARVVPKYHQFLELFPDITSLSKQPLAAVLSAWSGLGYNRRAKFLWQAVQSVVAEHSGHLPDTVESLVSLPGVGKNTAGAIMAYAYNQPVVFIETNIRTIFIYHFFKDETEVPDSDIVPLINQVLDIEHPREWYWALMDYGVYLKATYGNTARTSRHYKKQSVFEGSRRQIRGKILRFLSVGPMSFQALSIEIADERFQGVLDDLLTEALVRQNGDILSL